MAIVGLVGGYSPECASLLPGYAGWATFEAPQGSSLDALMPFPSPQPLSKYAFSSAYPYMTHNPLDFFGPPILHPAGEWSPMSLPSLNGLGLRIEGQSLLAPLTALQLALFSDAAYGSATAVAGYNEISLGTFSSQQGSGFGAKAFLDNSGSRIVLAFAGTDDLLDLIGADSAFLKSQPTDTLKSYVSYATTVVQFLAEKNPGVEITFTGHSLGGAIAQIIAKATGSNATTFDAPGAKQFLPYLTTELSLLPPLPKPSGTQQITNYRVYGDLVSTVGTQLGATKTYEPPVNAHIVDAFPIGAAKSMHLLGTIIERIVNNAPIAVSSGPSAASAGGTLLKTVLKPSILGVIRQGVNGVVLAGDAFFIDPQDVDAYGLAADAGSPLFRSVTFPFLLDLDAVFRLEEFDNGLWVSDGLFDELSTYDFGLGGVDQFRFFVLNRNNLLPPITVEPFTFGVTFVSDGEFSGTLTSYSTRSVGAIPEPSTISLFVVTLCVLMLLSKYSRRAQRE